MSNQGRRRNKRGRDRSLDSETRNEVSSRRRRTEQDLFLEHVMYQLHDPGRHRQTYSSLPAERGPSSYARRGAKTTLSNDRFACKICGGLHSTNECIDLRMDSTTFNQTTRAFRYWCPFHKQPHPMDECRQLHVWVSDPELVHRLLITESADAPAFATNLISWPNITRDTDIDLPWSADYSHKMWKDHRSQWNTEQARGPIVSHRGPDPAPNHYSTWETLPYQTASGNAPLFHSLQYLAEFAKSHPGRVVQDMKHIKSLVEINAKHDQYLKKYNQDVEEECARFDARNAWVQTEKEDCEARIVETKAEEAKCKARIVEDEAKKEKYEAEIIEIKAQKEKFLDKKNREAEQQRRNYEEEKAALYR
ncbi:hypothetical protein F4680DRAFT_469708 [Xylaria scruposa]|nr:hypothetical protein F4680DRAFT_469708 [Xylaria scruposa]